MTFFLITYTDHTNGKHLEKAEVVEGEDGPNLMKQLMDMNARKLMSSTTYKYYNLSVILEDNKLKIIGEATAEDDEQVKEDVDDN